MHYFAILRDGGHFLKTDTLFCGYSYHTQPFYSHHKSGYPSYLIRLQTEGACEAIVKGNHRKLEKGDLLLIKPGDHYELMVDSLLPDKAILSGDYHLICEGEWIEEWWKRSNKPDVARIDADERLLSLWRHLIIELRRPSKEEYNELSDYLLRSLCISLERSLKETSLSAHRPYAVTRMLRFIEEHALSSFKVEEAAAHAGLSVSRAVHLFKESTGKTIMEYAMEIRLAAAEERMKYTTMTLEQIAEDCGFGTYPYFHRVFSKMHGRAPGVYRRMEYGGMGSVKS
jgi:AraC family transcriptional regulator, arabinose operon regulatory protein